MHNPIADFSPARLRRKCILNPVWGWNPLNASLVTLCSQHGRWQLLAYEKSSEVN